MRLKILFAGIDGSGKTTCLNSLVPRLQCDYRILQIGVLGPHFFSRDCDQLLVKTSWSKKLRRLRELASRYHLSGIFLIFHFVYKDLLARYHTIANEHDLLMFESDQLLHPAVYIVYHFPFMSRIPPTLRFWALRLFFGSKQNVTIVYLDADPGRCIDRINRRGEEVQKHENQRDLGKLSAEFEKMIAVAKNSGFEILRIDVNVKSAAEVTEEVELAVRRKLCALA